jgi:hypothetical protein
MSDNRPRIAPPPEEEFQIPMISFQYTHAVLASDACFFLRQA